MSVIEDGRIKDSSRVKFNNPVIITDADWVKTAFMIPSGNIDEQVRGRLTACSADNKLTDTTLGGSETINNRPQFTRYADIRRKGRIATRVPVKVDTRTGNHGQGRYYSKAIDDNKSVLMLSPGVPKFRSLLSFISRAVDLDRSTLASEGRTRKWYDVGKAAGTVAAILMGTIFPGAILVMFGLKLINSLVSNSSMDGYYTIKPMLHTYWGTVNSLVNMLAPNIGLISPEIVRTKGAEDNIGVPISLNQEDLDGMRRIAPHIFTKSGFLDVKAIANRTNVLISKQLKLERKLLSEGTLTKEKLTKHYQQAYLPEAPLSTEDFFEVLKKGDIGKSYGKLKVEDQENVTPQSVEDPKTYSEPQEDGTYKRSPIESTDGFMSDAFNYFKASTSHGSHFVNFDVEYIGTATDTFTNTFKEIPIKDKFNSVGGAIRDVRFSTAGGNIFGDPVKNVTDGLKDMGLGALDGFTAGFSNLIKALMDGGSIHLPQMWDDSNISVAEHTFKMPLISPYGHPLSSLQALYLPIACLLPFVLPIGTGQASYVSPYLTSAHLKGMCDIKLGMMKNLTITRGVSNLPYSKDKRPLAFDVSFSIIDLDGLINAPISADPFAPVSMSFDESNGLNRYLNIITAKDIHSMTYMKPKALLAYTRLLGVIETNLSPASLGMRAGNMGNMDFYGLLLQEDNSVETLRGF